eukprot:1947422-Amphidinium_carterae.1
MGDPVTAADGITYEREAIEVGHMAHATGPPSPDEDLRAEGNHVEMLAAIDLRGRERERE